MVRGLRKQVDQSGRLEDARVTVWAYANGETRSLAMSAAVKRRAFAALKRRRITGARALMRLYTAALVLLLRPIITANGLVVELDREYPGYEADIKAMLLRKLWDTELDVPAEAITWTNVGKNAMAHDVAWRVFVGLDDPDVRVAWPDVERAL